MLAAIVIMNRDRARLPPRYMVKAMPPTVFEQPNLNAIGLGECAIVVNLLAVFPGEGVARRPGGSAIDCCVW